MATTSQAFYCLWQQDRIREKLFEVLSKEDICSVRLASSACCNLVTKRLFLRTSLTFSASTFTRQSRVQALSRIGHHIEHLTFYFPHSDATFLPPLIHPESGQEISFLYTPHTSMASVLARPKFANTGLGEILTQQYPPLFHAASNVPSFINAMKHVPNMRHLTIKTPGQNAKERYRRDIVDYALISLRISLERAPLTKLHKLSLSAVHPSAFNYLRHVPGFGCTPSAGRRWQQIRKLQISVEAWDFYGPSPGLDHLKMLDDYIRNFADSVEKFSFTWLGRKGPCPVSLAADPLFAPPRSSQKLFAEVTSPMSPLPPPPSRRPIRFRRLRYLSVRNATMNAPQVAELVASHHRCVREFDFDNVVLINGGSWDDALAPLMDHATRSDHWVRQSVGSMTDVDGGIPSSPTMMPPYSPDAAATPRIEEEFSVQSPAVAAVSEELFNIDLHGGADDEDEDLGAEYAQRWVNGEFDDSDQAGGAPLRELDSDLEAARQASLLPPSKLKKRRVTKRRKRRKQHDQDGNTTEQEEPAQPKPSKLSPLRFHRRQQKSEDSIREEQQQHQRLASPPPPMRSPEPAPFRLPVTPPPRLAAAAQFRSPRLFGELDRAPSRASNNSNGSSNGGRRLFGELDRSPSTPPTSMSRPPMSRRGISSRGSGGASITSPSASLLFGEITVPELSRSPIDDSASATSDDYFRPITPVTYYGGYDNSINNDRGCSGSSMGRTRELTSLLSSLHHRYDHLHEQVYEEDNKNNDAEKMTISSPILDTKPSMPALLLQPTVYNPLQPAVYNPGEPCSEITAVQRDIEAEEAQRRIAEDPGLRASMLRKAKATVLSKLSEHFPSSGANISNNTNYNGGSALSRKLSRKGSMAATAAANNTYGTSLGMRFRFGGGGGARNNIHPAAASTVSTLTDVRSMDVPLLFSRG
ncbi:hypothetical protein PG999_007267 [Apiospora kogelbergensis]|uniref:F-box domain-containing protein n=1 Tax=Apiospora kogelbergensis TaxID=1337665 RepID=A0AAW0QXY9_9PEZI